MGDFKFYSQAKQDKFIFEIIMRQKKNSGFFIEIGAYDGVTFSNSYFFEKSLNWNGICVEPIEKYFNNIKQTRTCEVLNAAISNYDGKTNFTHVENSPMFSGISENLEKEFSENLETNKSKVETFSVKIKKYNLKKITYLSMDTEGGEEIILKNIPFDKIKIDIISVEDNLNLKKVDKILENNDFVLVKHAIFDKIFINKNSVYYSKCLFMEILKAKLLNRYVNCRFDKITRPILRKNLKLKTQLLKLINN
jgi:FkbM family methyltransferase